MDSTIKDLVEAARSWTLDKESREVSWLLLNKLADEGSTEARQAIAQLGREAKHRKRKVRTARATFGDAFRIAKEKKHGETSTQ
jgi:hypothetical protein